MAKLNRDELRDRILGCWTGKNIGGTLGGPFEGRREILDVTGYTTRPGEPLPNDDLDLQLVWLKAVRERGPMGVTAPVLGEYWLNYIPPPWNEYGINKANQRAGLPPPLSGMYQNPWKHSNGAWIRSEIWACLAPGCPDVAIRYAYEDASVDHGGAEGMYAELFTASVQSAAFVVHDRDELIEIGLSKIPDDCRVARAVRTAIARYQAGDDWKTARKKVVDESVDLGWFMAPANVAFVVIGWLYGDGDFGKSICIAVSCGDDTDCTGATLGAILGILNGRTGIPQEWTEPIGERILTIAIDRGSAWDWPNTLQELTDRVMETAPVVLGAHRAPVAIWDKATDLTDIGDLKATDTSRALCARSSYSVRHDLVHTVVEVDYRKEPVVSPGMPFPIRIVLRNAFPDQRQMEVAWHLPEGWQVSPTDHVTTQLMDWQTKSLDFEIMPGDGPGAKFRGILEVSAVARPTIGLIPLLFFRAMEGRVP